MLSIRRNLQDLAVFQGFIFLVIQNKVCVGLDVCPIQSNCFFFMCYSHICEERGSSVLFGFFLQPDFVIYDDPLDFGFKSPPPTKFLSTSDEGKDLKNGKWGSLDASLSFLGADGTVYIIGASNGLLLRSTERHQFMNFLVCNPITTEFRVLPKPHKAYRY